MKDREAGTDRSLGFPPEAVETGVGACRCRVSPSVMEPESFTPGQAGFSPSVGRAWPARPLSRVAFPTRYGLPERFRGGLLLRRPLTCRGTLPRGVVGLTLSL